MVVDDNCDAADLTADLLLTAGHEVEIAHDGEEAIRQACRFRPEIVVLDIGLPDLDGYQVAAAIRTQCREPLPRFIALSGYGQLQDRRRSREEGFAAHLVKPVDPDQLLDTLWRVVNEGQAAPGPGGKSHESNTKARDAG
jgi:CheY-like chemotaxis protein